MSRIKIEMNFVLEFVQQSYQKHIYRVPHFLLRLRCKRWNNAKESRDLRILKSTYELIRSLLTLRFAFYPWHVTKYKRRGKLTSRFIPAVIVEPIITDHRYHRRCNVTYQSWTFHKCNWKSAAKMSVKRITQSINYCE